MKQSQLETGTLYACTRGARSGVVAVLRKETWHHRQGRIMAPGRRDFYANGVLVILRWEYTNPDHIGDTLASAEKDAQTLSLAKRYDSLSDEELSLAIETTRPPEGHAFAVIPSANLTETVAEYDAAVAEETERQRQRDEEGKTRHAEFQEIVESLNDEAEAAGLNLGLSAPLFSENVSVSMSQLRILAELVTGTRR